MAKQKTITKAKASDDFSSELYKLLNKTKDNILEEDIGLAFNNILGKNKAVDFISKVSGKYLIESNKKMDGLNQIIKESGIELLLKMGLEKFFPEDMVIDTIAETLTDEDLYTSKNKPEVILAHVRDNLLNTVVLNGMKNLSKVDFETKLSTLGIKASEVLTTVKAGAEGVKAGIESIGNSIGETMGGLGENILSSSSYLVNTGKTMASAVASSSSVNTAELMASDVTSLLGPYAPAVSELILGKADMTPWKDLYSNITTGKPTKETQDNEKAEQEMCEESYVFSNGDPNPFYGEQEYGKHNPNYNIDHYSKKDLINLKKELDSGKNDVLGVFGDTSGNKILKVMKKIYPDFNYKKHWYQYVGALSIGEKFDKYIKKAKEHPVFLDKISYDKVHDNIKKHSKLLNYNKLIYPKYYFNTPSTTLPKIKAPKTWLPKITNITPKNVKGNYSLTKFDPNVFKKRAITKNNKVRVVKITPKRSIYYKNVNETIDVNKLFNSLKAMLREQIAVYSEGAH